MRRKPESRGLEDAEDAVEYKVVMMTVPIASVDNPRAEWDDEALWCDAKLSPEDREWLDVELSNEGDMNHPCEDRNSQPSHG